MQLTTLFRNSTLTILVLLCSHFARAGGGGSDQFGYTWVDSHDSSLTFKWVDILARPGATQVTTLTDDNFSEPIPLGFAFRHYWIDFSQLRIGSNGWLSLGTPALNNTHCFQPMPSPALQSSNSTLAVLLSDLTFNSSYPTLPNVGEVWYWTSPSADSFVVSYLNVPWWKDDNQSSDPPDWIGSNTFQVILSALDSSITYQYLRVSQDSMPTYPSCVRDVMVGMENSTGLIGLTVQADSLPGDSFAIKFIYPKVDSFQVSDMTTVWNHNPASKSFFIKPGDTIHMRSMVRNAGNTPFTGDVLVEGKVLSQGQNLRWVEVDTLDGLAAATDTLIHFSHPCMLALPGQYYCNTTITSPEDLNGTNDFLSTEIIVVDTHPVIPVVTYCTGTPTSNSISWPPGIGSNNGAGVYMRPPWDYYRLNAIEVFIVGNDGNPLTPLPAGFRLEVYAEDSTTGGIGSMLISELVTASQGLEDDWNLIFPASSPQFIRSGFYVAWIQGGAGIGLGSEQAGPRSRQTYEIINGMWAPYRNLTTEDFLVKVHIEPLLVGSLPPVEEEKAHLVVFPNPGQGKFTVEWEQEGMHGVHLRVLDVEGRVVYGQEWAKRAPGQHQQDFHLENESDGVYFIEIVTPHARKATAFVLER